jgi:hypothetical protein
MYNVKKVLHQLFNIYVLISNDLVLSWKNVWIVKPYVMICIAHNLHGKKIVCDMKFGIWFLEGKLFGMMAT